MQSKRAVIAVSVILSAALILTATALFINGQVAAQDQTALTIDQRLRQQGVPVTSVIVKSRTPLHVEIVLHSTSSDYSPAFSDIWPKFLAEREATFAYRRGSRLSGYTVRLMNATGQMVYEGLTFLYPSDFSQMVGTPVSAKLDNQSTAQLIRDQLDFQGMSVASLDVTSGGLTTDDAQFARLRLTVPDITSASPAVSRFIPSLRPALERLNATRGTSIAVCYVSLMDSGGQDLLEYVLDLEMRRETSKLKEGIQGWFSPPPINPLNSPLPTP